LRLTAYDGRAGTVEIRRAVAADVSAIARLNGDVQRLHAAAHGQLFKPAGEGEAILSWFATALAKPGAHLLIGAVEGELVGYIYGQVTPYPENPFRYPLEIGLIDQLSIRPTFQRRGYGEALLDALLAIFREAGLAQVELSVWAFNESARRFYERRGFATVQHRMSLDFSAATSLATASAYVGPLGR
jgi:ribosomal protein S18 acetylase RimI-like enzyme